MHTYLESDRSILRFFFCLFAVALTSCDSSPQSKIIGHYVEKGDGNVQLDITPNTIAIHAAPLTLTFPYTVQSTDSNTVNISYSGGDGSSRRFQAQIHVLDHSVKIDGADFGGTTYIRK